MFKCYVIMLHVVMLYVVTLHVVVCCMLYDVCCNAACLNVML